MPTIEEVLAVKTQDEADKMLVILTKDVLDKNPEMNMTDADNMARSNLGYLLCWLL